MGLFVFGVTLEAINNPKELTAILFTPWDFLTYGVIALAILTLICLLRKRDPRKALPGNWTSQVAHEGVRIRTGLRLAPNGDLRPDRLEAGAKREYFRVRALAVPRML